MFIKEYLMSKILHVCSGNYYGGIEEVARLMAKTQIKNGSIADIVYFEKDFELNNNIKNNLLLKLYYYFKYVKLVKLNKYDILHNHSGGLFIDLINILLFRNRTLISHNHGCRIRKYVLKLEPKYVSMIKQLFSKMLYSKIIRISVSQYMYNLQIYYEATDKKYHYLLQNPIDFDNLNCNIKFKKNIILGYIGRIVEDKGIIHFIQLANHIKNNRLKYKLLIAGLGDFSDEFQNLIRTNKLEEIITFNNYYMDKKIFFSEIDIFITLPNFESFGLTIYEALYCQKPIITLQKKSIDENLYGVVWCLEDAKPESILIAIDEINEDKINLEEELKKLKTYLLANYSVEKYENILTKIYNL